MELLNLNSGWNRYKNHVQQVVLNNEPRDTQNVSYWRNAVFCKILTYLTPLSLIALVPSVVVAFINGLPVVGFTDLFTFFTIVLITLAPGIKLKIRKAVFIFIFYFLSVVLLCHLPLPGPALLYLLTVTIFTSLIYSSAAAYYSAWANTFISVCFALVLYLGIEPANFLKYGLDEWLATSSNLVLLSFACAKCIDLLLGGLNNSLKEHTISKIKLEKANRLYRFISQINQTIVHVKDPEKLIHNACRIAFETGKYQLAWVSCFDTANKTISLLDSMGIPDKDVQLFTDVPYENGGPQEYVLSTGKYFLCNNCENSVEIDTWKPIAEKYNIGSFIVLPIKKSGSVYGTFNLFATKPDYFEEDEIAVLLEAAGDLSFALDLFERAERHKEAEEIIIKNEKLFRALIEKSADMETLADADGKPFYASPSVSKKLGYTREEFFNMPPTELVHPDDISMVIEKMKDIKYGNSEHSIHRLKHKKGNYIWCEGNITNMLHEPYVNAWVSNFRDISDKRKAELELQKNFTELEALSKEQAAILNTLPASIALLDHEGNILKVNEEWRNFGKTNGLPDFYEHLSKNYIEISEKSEGRDSEEGMQMALGLKEILRGASDYFTMVYPCDSPTEKRWFKAEVKPFKNHNLTGAVVMHINITERKKAEAEMLLLMNNTEESFILLNKDLKIVSFNKQFKHLYKEYFGLEIHKGDLILDYVQPHRKEIVTSIYKNVLKGNIEEYEIKTPVLNSTKYFLLKYSPAKDETGNIFGAFVTALDITEKKKAEEQKEFERRDKEALINSTDDFIWSVSTDYKLIAANNSFIKEIEENTGIQIKHGDDLLDFDLFPAEYLKYWEELYNKALSGESYQSEIYALPVNSKKESWIETFFNPIISNGEIVGIACYARDITERKKSRDKLIQTSAALQQALNDLNKIMDSSLDVICAVDAEGTFLKVSAASKSIWGYTPEELIGTPIFAIVYQEDIEKTQVSAKNVMAGNELNHFENRYVRKDGTVIPIEWSARWDAKDQIRYGVARDVTEKKRLEKAVENERQRFKDLFSEAPSSMGVLSGPNHVFEIVNPLFLQLIGKKDIIGKTVKEVLPEAVDQGLIDLLDGVYNTGETFSANEMLVKLDTLGTGKLVDKYLNFMYQAHRTEKDTIDGILFFAVDVTEQVVLRLKIEENEAKLKEAQAIAHIGNWEIDMLTYTHTWSDEFYNILGINKHEKQPSAEAFLSFIHPDDVMFAEKKMQTAFETLEASSFNFRFIAPDVTVKYGYTEWELEFDIQNNPIRLYGILQDVTERKIAEEEREKLIHDLIQRNRDLEQFTFIISHNLRAPTANIIGLNDMLQVETLPIEERKELLQGISLSVSKLDNVIRDINSILQVKLEINEKKELISFSKLIDEIFISYGNLKEEHHVRINHDFSEVDEIFSLKVYMHSIFYNLISNSIKYSKPGEQPIIAIKSKKENGKIILIFKDNGLGIDMKTNGDKVFRLYNRFHFHVEGKGMGLFMVKTQVEAIGGKISVESEPNKGAEFTIVFEN